MNDTDIARALGTTDPPVNTDDALVRFRARVQSEGIAIGVSAPKAASTAGVTMMGAARARLEPPMGQRPTAKLPIPLERSRANRTTTSPSVG